MKAHAEEGTEGAEKVARKWEVNSEPCAIVSEMRFGRAICRRFHVVIVVICRILSNTQCTIF